jgi:mannose-6-phosphate isomerase-like protein (cupin superfamily)
VLHVNNTAINLQHKLGQFTDLWAPRIVAQVNDHQLKLVKVQGDFVWHRHLDTDEVFYVLSGELRIDFCDRSVTLRQGELLVVPKGIEHKPFALHECHVLLIEPAGTINTGSARGERTAPNDEWI